MAKVESIQLYRMDDGSWSWEVDFDDRGLNQDGFERTFAAALRCIHGALENADVRVEIAA